MIDRPSPCPVQVSLCASTVTRDDQGGSSAELAACYAFAALAPTHAFFPSSGLLFACRGGLHRPSVEEAHPVQTSRTRRCSSHHKPSKSARWLFKQEKQKLFHTSSYTVQPPMSIPCRTLFEPKMTPSQCMQNATTRFSAPNPWPPIQTVYRFGCSHRAVVSSPPPTFPTHKTFDVPDYFKKKREKI